MKHFAAFGKVAAGAATICFAFAAKADWTYTGSVLSDEASLGYATLAGSSQWFVTWNPIPSGMQLLLR